MSNKDLFDNLAQRATEAKAANQAVAMSPEFAEKIVTAYYEALAHILSFEKLLDNAATKYRLLAKEFEELKKICDNYAELVKKVIATPGDD